MTPHSTPPPRLQLHLSLLLNTAKAEETYIFKDGLSSNKVMLAALNCSPKLKLTKARWELGTCDKQEIIYACRNSLVSVFFAKSVQTLLV